jgi:Molecular chaperone (small heat shock protein)
MARAPKDGPTGREAIEEIDRRLGGLLGGLAEGLAKIADAAEAAQDASGAREATIETDKGPVRVRAGYSVRVGGLAARGGAAASSGRDPAEPVSPGGAKAAEPGAAPAVEPVLDVFEGPEGWRLAADMPGASEADLSVAVEGGRVIVESGGARRYRAEAEAPVWLTREMLEIRLANGVLELSAPRPEGAA